MKHAYSFDEIIAAEKAAMRAGESERSLMEKAGACLAERVRAAIEAHGDAIIVCGGGKNGGDGFVCARILREEGTAVDVLCLKEDLPPLVREVREALGGEVLGRIPRRKYAVTVDCLFGTGLSRPVEGENAALVDFIQSGDYILSCDVPTGLTRGGVAMFPAVEANETLTMGAIKQELLLSDGADLAGKIEVADIGLRPEGEGALLYEDGDVAAFFPKRRSNTHKGNYGVACILAGGTFSGAAFLSAGACLKSGVGYTRLSVTGSVFPHAIGKLPAAILREFTAIDGEILASDCIAVGMGTGVSERLYVHLVELLSAYTGDLLLDADALNTLSVYGVGILKEKSCRVVITPHPKEFSRLTGESVEEILKDPVGKAKRFAREFGVVVVLKNNRTVITDGERVAVNTTGSPVLAKGGSGDVLSGFLAGTVARGVPVFEAACLSSYLTGRAGEIAERELGEYSPDATDVISRLPAAILSVLKK